MGYITFEDYKALGYDIAPEGRFERYTARAEAVVRKYTFARIEAMHPPESATDEQKRIAELNRRGMCELTDLYYLADNPNGEKAREMQAVTSFSNGGYSETRAGAGTNTEAQMGIAEIMSLFFTPEQLYRGIG